MFIRKKLLVLLTLILSAMVIMPNSIAALEYIVVDGIRYSINDDGDNTLTVRGGNQEVSYTGSINIPSTVEYNETSYTVTKIGADAFSDCASVTSITLPNTITFIDTRAFKNTGISEITIPESVIEISSDAFGNCTNLKSVNLENTGITSLPNYTFRGCVNLTEIKLPSNLLSIGNEHGGEVFKNCSKLSKIDLPNTLESIAGASVFEGCTSLDSISIPASVTNIDSWVFDSFYKREKENVVFEKGSKYKIIDGVLYDDTTLLRACDPIEEIIIPEGITTVAESAFTPVTDEATLENISFDVKSVTFPSTLEVIEGNAFFCCDSIGTVNFENVTKLNEIPENAFSACTSLTSIEIPKGVTEIGRGAFMGCVSVEYILLPNSLETIEPMAFLLGTPCDDFILELTFDEYNDSIRYINIPANVEEIGSIAFGGLNSNTVIEFEGTTPPSFKSGDTGTFAALTGENVPKPTVYYPLSAKEVYEAEGNALVTSGLITKTIGGEESGESGDVGGSTVSSTVKVEISSVIENSVDIDEYTLTEEILKSLRNMYANELVSEGIMSAEDAASFRRSVNSDLTLHIVVNKVDEDEISLATINEIISKLGTSSDTEIIVLDIDIEIRDSSNNLVATVKSLPNSKTLDLKVTLDPEINYGEGTYLALSKHNDNDFPLYKGKDIGDYIIAFEIDKFSTFVIVHRGPQSTITRPSTPSSKPTTPTDPCAERIGTGWVYDEAKGYCVYKGSGQMIPNTSVK